MMTWWQGFFWGLSAGIVISHLAMVFIIKAARKYARRIPEPEGEAMGALNSRQMREGSKERIQKV